MKYYEYISFTTGQTTSLARIEGQLYQRFDRSLMRWVEEPRLLLDMSGLGGGSTGDYKLISSAQARAYVEMWGGIWSEE